MQSVVLTVTHIYDSTIAIHSYGMRDKLCILPSHIAKRGHRLTLGREDRDAMIFSLTYIDFVLRVNGYPHRIFEFTLPPAVTPESSHKFPRGCEDLDAMVASVSHIYLPSAVTGYITRISIASASSPKSAGVGEVRVQNLNTVVIVLCNVYLLVTSIECHTTRVRELQTSIPFHPEWC